MDHHHGQHDDGHLHADHEHGGHLHTGLGHGGHHHEGDHDAAMAEVIELDAALGGSYADEAAEWIAALAAGPVREAVDLGAGTGVGTLALARRFPEARLTAVDGSPAMLERLRSAAEGAGPGSDAGAGAGAGSSSRLRTVEADLDGGWVAAVRPSDPAANAQRGLSAGGPEHAGPAADVGWADLAWASSSLHHVADPGSTLRGVFETLRPGGLLLVLELDGLPRFLEDAGEEPAALEQRCHRAVEAAGWNGHPDWGPVLEAAGFEPAGRRVFEVHAQDSPQVRRFARLYLERLQAGIGGPRPAGHAGHGHATPRPGVAGPEPDPADRAALDALLGHGLGSLDHLPVVGLRTRRTAWAARRPANPS
ncbi:class I SAM-dependent methyltransferase [Zafaria sp. Z1313]|uniref:class I SAM-dependent methyltransferase n=1 Tax=Zafaria sp. Z1313 TaxID=3423202 RepID=UPI003D3024CC